jgi:hypothetical protein
MSASRLPAHQVDLAFAEQRMGWISGHASLGQLGRRRSLSCAADLRPAKEPPAGSAAEGFAISTGPPWTGWRRAGVTIRLGAELRQLARIENGSAGRR